MLKRFTLGFVIGLGGMYYYLHYADDAAEDAGAWVEESASGYRGDEHKRRADELLGARGL